MNTQIRNAVLHFFSILISLVFSQIAIAATSKQDRVTPKDITKKVRVLGSDAANTLSVSLEIKDHVIDVLDKIKSEKVKDIFGENLILQLNKQGFEVDEMTTMQNIYDLQCYEEFFSKWLADNPQELANISNKIGCFCNKSKAKPSVTSSACLSGLIKKAMIGFGLLVGKLGMTEAMETPMTAVGSASICKEYIYSKSAYALSHDSVSVAFKPMQLVKCCKEWMMHNSSIKYFIKNIYLNKRLTRNIYIPSDALEDFAKTECPFLLAGVGATITAIIVVAVGSVLYCRKKKKLCFARDPYISATI